MYRHKIHRKMWLHDTCEGIAIKQIIKNYKTIYICTTKHNETNILKVLLKQYMSPTGSEKSDGQNLSNRTKLKLDL